MNVFLEYFIVGSCILVYLSYTIFKNLCINDAKNYEIWWIHSHLNAGFYSVEDFLEIRTLYIKNICRWRNLKKKIFFIETYLDEVRILDGPRIACSVESAGKTEAKIKLKLLKN